jgi:hypothetical protein
MWEGVDWMHVTLDRDKQQDIVNTVYKSWGIS